MIPPRRMPPGGARPRIGIAGGVLRLGTFRAAGMAGIPDGRQAFINSFAPMLALSLVGGFLLAMSGHVAFALESVGSTVVAMLGQPVVSHWFAVKWDREGPWLRYATAVNWCQWAPMLAIFVLMPLVQIAIGMGFRPDAVAVALIVVLIGYALALSFFLARVGLGVSRRRAVLLVVAVHVVLAIVVEGPALISGR